jgi:hypothetical protein
MCRGYPICAEDFEAPKAVVMGQANAADGGKAISTYCAMIACNGSGIAF